MPAPLTTARHARAATIAVLALVFSACGASGSFPVGGSPTTSSVPSASPAASAGHGASGTVTATASPSLDPGAAGPATTGLELVPTACYGLGPADCRRVVAHVATRLTADDPPILYVQVGPFGCPDGVRCPVTLEARSEGDVMLEFAGGSISMHIAVAANGAVSAERQEAFGISLPPTTVGPSPTTPRSLALGHCGLFSGVDIGGSWWDPVGAIDFDHPDAINAAEGVIAFQGTDRAVFTSATGFTVQLLRRPVGVPKYLPFCD